MKKTSINRISRLFVVLGLALFLVSPVFAQKNRADISEKYKWNLQDIYANDEAWNQAKEEVAAQFDKILEFKGTLTSSSENLLACLDFTSELMKEAYKLFSYASMKSDEDTRISKNLSMQQELEQMFTDYSAKAAYIEPEILSVDWSVIENFMKEEPKLQVYSMSLGNLFRRKAHTLSEPEEKILAQAGLISGNAANIYNLFSNAEMPYPTVTLSDGSTVTLDKSGYSKYRAVPNRSDRELVFHEFWSAFEKFKGSYGEQLYGNVKSDIFYAKARGYNSSLERALDANNIPVDVYHSLIDNVNKNLGTFHRYLKLKKRMMGLDTLKYSDLYAPAVKGVDLKYNYDEAKALLLEAVKPLGDEYVNVVSKALNERWIDVYPTPGKRSGAYSSGNAYDVHPYILLNYNDQYDDVSTLAHEMGHTMHSYFSNKTQPFPKADYSIFVAEVASTFNEALLNDMMLKKIKDNDTRLSLLMSYLDNFKGTLFRQTQFAEYELLIHEKAEQGIPLTGDLLTELYGEILKKYYGADEGVCLIDNLVVYEWAYIPHFYYNYYVYQYSTSFTASTALAEKVLNKEKGAKEKYMAFLSAGGSDYPINVLKTAGVDMTTSEPFEKAMAAMNRIMDEIEKILDSKK
ncbi:MAG: oligoendopeptidase F [Bacteroidales bacterium]|nr:oligoendopeptidase F [Bacteroidales bacterium]